MRRWTNISANNGIKQHPVMWWYGGYGVLAVHMVLKRLVVQVIPSGKYFLF